MAFASPTLTAAAPPVSNTSTLQPGAPATATPTPALTARPTATRTPDATATRTLPPSPTPTGSNPNNGQPSPRPTRTPTATPTATATATTSLSACQPATQKAPPNAGWTINHVCIYQWASGEWEVYGELTNNTGSDQIGVDLDVGVDVEVNFYDSGGDTLVTASSWIDVLTLPNGATAPFLISAYSASAPLQYDFSVSATLASESPRRDLQVVDGQVSRIDSDVVFTGRVTNPGADPFNYAEVVVTFYGRDGAVVAIGNETIYDENVAGGQTAFLEISAYGQVDLIDLSRPPAVLVLGY